MKGCPRCSKQLANSAKTCECGWKERTAASENLNPAPPRPRCRSCENDAKVKVLLEGEWVNLCVPCEIAQHTAQAKASNAAKGIHDAKDAREWLKHNKLMVKRGPVFERQPGEE